MAKKTNSKEKRSLVCVTAPGRGGTNKVCSLMTQKEIKKLWTKFKAKGKFVKEISHF